MSNGEIPAASAGAAVQVMAATVVAIRALPVRTAGSVLRLAMGSLSSGGQPPGLFRSAGGQAQPDGGVPGEEVTVERAAGQQTGPVLRQLDRAAGHVDHAGEARP